MQHKLQWALACEGLCQGLVLSLSELSQACFYWVKVRVLHLAQSFNYSFNSIGRSWMLGTWVKRPHETSWSQIAVFCKSLSVNLPSAEELSQRIQNKFKVKQKRAVCPKRINFWEWWHLVFQSCGSDLSPTLLILFSSPRAKSLCCAKIQMFSDEFLCFRIEQLQTQK